MVIRPISIWQHRHPTTVWSKAFTMTPAQVVATGVAAMVLVSIGCLVGWP